MFVSLELGAMCHVMMCVIVIVEFWKETKKSTSQSVRRRCFWAFENFKVFSSFDGFLIAINHHHTGSDHPPSSTIIHRLLVTMPHIRRLILTFISFCLIGVVAKEVSLFRRKFPIQRRRVVPRRREEQLHIRGGNVVFKKRTIAQVASAVSFLQGCSCWLMPGRTCRTYGIDAQLIHEWAMRQVGIILLQFGLVGGCLFTKRCSLNTSIGVATLMRCAESCRCLMTNEPQILEFAALPHYSLVLNGVLAYIALSSQPFADTVNKLHGVCLFASGLVTALQPRKMLELAGFLSADRILLKLIRGYGLWVLSLSIFLGGLAWDLEPPRALAFSRIVIFLRTLMVHFVLNRSGTFNTKQVPWLIYHALIATLLML
jgi:hypothetical protein